MLRQVGQSSRPGRRPPERADHGNHALRIEHVGDGAKEAADVRVLRLLEGATRVTGRILGRSRVEVHPGKACVPGRIEVGFEAFGDNRTVRQNGDDRTGWVSIHSSGSGLSTRARKAAIPSFLPASVWK